VTPEKCDMASCSTRKPAVYHVMFGKRKVRLCEVCYRKVAPKSQRRPHQGAPR
jgi:hypothetical protein